MTSSRAARASTIGVLGGGPVGRMISVAARTLGYRVRVLETEHGATSAGIANVSLRSHRRDIHGAAKIAHGCDVITAAFEDIPEEVLVAAAAEAPLRPGMTLLGIAQERKLEREWLEKSGFNVLPWRAADSREELVAHVAALGGVCVVKPRTRRHAPFRPLLVTSESEAKAAWIAVRGRPAVVEARADIALELAILVARGSDGATQVYPPAVAVRDDMQLAWSVLPGPLPGRLAEKASALAAYMARKLGVEGLLAVEMFVLDDGALVVNEIVPAPHPTYNASGDAFATGQFEQLVRCITGMPLGATTVVQPTAGMSVLSNGYGALAAESLERALKVAGVRVQVYEASHAVAGTPVAHLSAVGATVEEATSRLLRAHAELDRKRARRLSRRHLTLARQAAPRRPARAARADPHEGVPR